MSVTPQKAICLKKNIKYILGFGRLIINHSLTQFFFELSGNLNQTEYINKNAFDPIANHPCKSTSPYKWPWPWQRNNKLKYVKYHFCTRPRPWPMTLILKLDLDMAKICLHTKNEVPMWSGSKIIAWTDTDTQTDTQKSSTTDELIIFDFEDRFF